MEKESFLATLNGKEILMWKVESYWGKGMETGDKKEPWEDTGLELEKKWLSTGPFILGVED